MFGDCVSGHGTYAWTDGRMYTGAFGRARPHGRGSLQFPDGRVESGTWDEGKRIGRRVIAAPSAVARWRKQAAPPTGCTAGECGGGQGTFRWGDGSSYTGSFRRSQPHGQGTWIHPSGRAYAGGWKNGNRHGPGSETHSTGETLRGIWYEGRLTESASAAGPAAPRTARSLGPGTTERLPWPDLSRSARVLGGGERDAAVVVGIESYAHVASVPGARENAAAWYEWLVRTRRVPLERVSLLVDQDATREEIRFAVGEAAKQVDRRGTLWFVFIGHGAPARSGRDGLLVGYDAQQKARSLETRSLERSDLLERLAEGPAAQIQVFLDACFSGRGPGGEALVAGLQPLVVTSDTAGADERTNVFTAARNDEYAGPLPGARRPAFSYLALGGLRGWADRDGDGALITTASLTYS